MGARPRILIVGGGYGGLRTALRLDRMLRPGEATVMVADPRSYTTYQPLLAEAAAGNLEPRHVVVPLRGVLRSTQVIKATVSSIDHARRVAYLATGGGEETPVGYDMLVLAPGSIFRVLPIPGLAETGIGFKTIGEDIHLRNHVLGRLDAAASATLAEARRAALTFVFVGGGYVVHRTYHLLKLPTMNRRLRVVADWTLALLLPREFVSLDVLEHPRQDFEAALRVIATGPSRQTSFPAMEEKEDDQHAYHR